MEKGSSGMISSPTLSALEGESVLVSTSPLRELGKIGFLVVSIHHFSRSIFLNTALLFWSFHIKADPTSPLDEWAFTESANTHPLPFRVIFEPRVLSTAGALKEILEDYGI
jgi:hypothetical protein